MSYEQIILQAFPVLHQTAAAVASVVGSVCALYVVIRGGQMLLESMGYDDDLDPDDYYEGYDEQAQREDDERAALEDEKNG